MKTKEKPPASNVTPQRLEDLLRAKDYLQDAAYTPTGEYPLLTDAEKLINKQIKVWEKVLSFPKTKKNAPNGLKSTIDIFYDDDEPLFGSDELTVLSDSKNLKKTKTETLKSIRRKTKSPKKSKPKKKRAGKP